MGALHLTDLTDVAAANGGILRRQHLNACGLTPNRILELMAEGSLARVHRDAYRIPSEDEHPLTTFHASVTALRWRDPTRILTGPAALSVLGIPVFGEPRTLHVATDRRGGSSARSLVSTVAAPPADQVITSDGTLVAAPARAALDTARLHSLVAGVVAADHALRTGLTTPEELTRVAERMGPVRGAALVRLCCQLASPQSESPGESWSAVVMHQNGIPTPERQAVFTDAKGFIGRVDFWWPGARVVGEFDGRVKYGRANPSGRPPEDVLWDEKLREDRLRAADAAVVRWTTADLRHPKHWIERLRAALA